MARGEPRPGKAGFSKAADEHSMTVKIPESEYKELQEHAAGSGSSPTALVRSLISVFLGARRAVKNGKPAEQDHIIETKGGDTEIVLVERDGISVRTCFHEEQLLADYVRVHDDRKDRELVYWSWTEWKEDTNDGEDPAAAMNAILSAIQMVAVGSYRQRMKVP